MSQYAIYALLAMIGLLIGIALLPWKARAFGDDCNTPMFLVGWAITWPFVLAYLAGKGLWNGALTYLKAWDRYRYARRSASSRN